MTCVHFQKCCLQQLSCRDPAFQILPWGNPHQWLATTQTCLWGCTHRRSGMWLLFSCGVPACARLTAALLSVCSCFHRAHKRERWTSLPDQAPVGRRSHVCRAPACKQDSCPISGLRNECERFSSILSAPVLPRAICFGWRCGGWVASNQDS